MTVELRLITDPLRREALLVESAAWAEAIDLCTPAVDSHLGRWRVWQALTAPPLRVRHAIIAVDGLRSEPHALEELHRAGVLRFVPAADGSFRPNLVRFRRGQQVRVAVGSGALVPDGHMAPLEAMTWWDGDELAPFALEVDRIFAQAQELAHVADPDELARYSEIYFHAASERHAIEALGAPLVRRTAADHEVRSLELVTEVRAVRDAVQTFKTRFKEATTLTVKQTLGHPGGSFTAKLQWCAPLGIWAIFGHDDETHIHFFGREYPDPSRSLQITVKATVPKAGQNRRIGAAIARDGDTAKTYIVHRGKIGGGRKGVGADLFWSRFRGGVEMSEPDREETSRVVIMGEIASPSLLRDVAAFVHEVGRIKESA